MCFVIRSYLGLRAASVSTHSSMYLLASKYALSCPYFYLLTHSLMYLYLVDVDLAVTVSSDWILLFVYSFGLRAVFALSPRVAPQSCCSVCTLVFQMKIVH